MTHGNNIIMQSPNSDDHMFAQYSNGKLEQVIHSNELGVTYKFLLLFDKYYLYTVTTTFELGGGLHTNYVQFDYSTFMFTSLDAIG